MLFTSIDFSLFFLALICALLLFKGRRQRLSVLLAFSYAFYAFSGPALTLLLLSISLLGWGAGYLIQRSREPIIRRAILVVDIAACLGALGYFKYANFLGGALSRLYDGPGHWAHLDIVLPIGISFFVFHNMSYVVDLYRGRGYYCRRLDDFMLYMAFFPQLVAGPIVRATEFLPQLERDIRFTRANISAGVQMLLAGFAQKLVLADNLGIFVDGVFANPALYTQGTLFLAVLSYTGQIFCDFSGYTLMALGLARILGFELPPNFRMPYLSLSVSEFWRRWHMSLSFWLRDYLYIPLGGSRKGTTRTGIAIMITMLLGGLWHGANWTFLAWGGLHGLALIVHRLWATNTSARLGRFRQCKAYHVAAWVFTLCFVCLAWIPFRSPDFSVTLTILHGLLSAHPGIEWYHSQSLVALALISAWHVIWRFGEAMSFRLPFDRISLGRMATMVVIGVLITAILLFSPVQTSPFIYFQF